MTNPADMAIFFICVVALLFLAVFMTGFCSDNNMSRDVSIHTPPLSPDPPLSPEYELHVRY